MEKNKTLCKLIFTPGKEAFIEINVMFIVFRVGNVWLP